MTILGKEKVDKTQGEGRPRGQRQSSELKIYRQKACENFFSGAHSTPGPCKVPTSLDKMPIKND